MCAQLSLRQIDVVMLKSEITLFLPVQKSGTKSEAKQHGQLSQWVSNTAGKELGFLYS